MQPLTGFVIPHATTTDDIAERIQKRTSSEHAPYAEALVDWIAFPGALEKLRR